ncbi:hypothetical protein CH339_14810 [Rhodobium orientis]|uniref:Uncharacterized protein n=1 Tax=Rhodobium orientis TaxID=34017 RepID=A0A327JK39_9HYPH|nr:hypothetical protein CH339_14810 [Rhodobium orientis]
MAVELFIAVNGRVGLGAFCHRRWQQRPVGGRFEYEGGGMALQQQSVPLHDPVDALVIGRRPAVFARHRFTSAVMRR